MFRTASALPELHRRISAAVPSTLELEIIYVDDACDQGSNGAVRSLQAADPRVKLERHPSNRGQHHAIRTGLRRSTGTMVVVLDGDLQDPPEAIPELLRRLGDGDVDAVFAGKSGRYEGRGRLISGRWFKEVMHRLGGVPRDAGGYVAMTRQLVDELLIQQLDSPYLLLGIAVTKRPCASIPVRRSKRPHGRSATSSRTRLRLGLDATRILIRENRK